MDGKLCVFLPSRHGGLLPDVHLTCILDQETGSSLDELSPLDVLRTEAEDLNVHTGGTLDAFFIRLEVSVCSIFCSALKKSLVHLK